MKFHENQYYHLYNRTNNEEALFRSDENYLYFLKKYRFYLDEFLDTIGYCLMPTHFHFLVRVKYYKKNYNSDVQHLADVGHLQISKNVGHLPDSITNSDVQHLADVGHLISRGMQTLQSSYTKAVNKRYNRHGSLFQAHFKSKPVSNDRYLISLLTYIHQNPVRLGLTNNAFEWKYSSYQDYIDLRNGKLPKKEIILSMIRKEELRDLTEKRLIDI